MRKLLQTKKSQNGRGGIELMRSHTLKPGVLESVHVRTGECGKDRKIGHKIRMY